MCNANSMWNLANSKSTLLENMKESDLEISADKTKYKAHVHDTSVE
jgi:hypothetical protein